MAAGFSASVSAAGLGSCPGQQLLGRGDYPKGSICDTRRVRRSVPSGLRATGGRFRTPLLRPLGRKLTHAAHLRRRSTSKFRFTLRWWAAGQWPVSITGAFHGDLPRLSRWDRIFFRKSRRLHGSGHWPPDSVLRRAARPKCRRKKLTKPSTARREVFQSSGESQTRTAAAMRRPTWREVAGRYGILLCACALINNRCGAFLRVLVRCTAP